MTSLRLLRYDLRRAGMTALTTPPGLLLFGAAAVALAANAGGQYHRVAATVMEALLPLGGGVSVASVLGADTSTELQLSLPTPYGRTVARRTLAVIGVVAVVALFATLVADATGLWRPTHGVGAGQLTWLAPLAALAGIGALTAALSNSTAFAASLVGAIWIGEQAAAGWFAHHGWAQPLFLFPETRGEIPSSAWLANRLTLCGIGVVGLTAMWALLRRPERLLGAGSSRLFGALRLRPAASPGTRVVRHQGRSGATSGAGIGEPKAFGDPAITPPVTAQVTTPGSWGVVVASARYEMRMQLQKRSLWVAILALGALFQTFKMQQVTRGHTASAVGAYAHSLNVLAPVIIGSLVADRLVRDRRLGVDELLQSTPTRFRSRFAGKYVGTVSACLLPLLVIWMVSATRMAVVRHDPAILGWAVVAFFIIEVPAVLFVSAFALGCPTVLGAPLFRVLFVGYWFWGNVVPSRILPTLSGTWLTPLGDVARVGFLGDQPGFGALAGHGAGVVAGAGSLALLMTLAVAALTAVTWRQEHLEATR